MWQQQPPLPADLRRLLESLSQCADPVAAARRESVAEAAHCAARGSWHRLWRFPCAPSAERWNAGWDAVLERPETVHPAFTQIEGAAIEDPFLEALARMTSAILSQEIQAGTPCPYVEAGFSYALGLEQQLHPSIAGLGERPYVLKLTGELRGPDGEPRWCSDASRVYTSETLPAPVAAVWSVRRFRAIEEVYASAHREAG
jgi:hypothetical protein